MARVLLLVTFCLLVFPLRAAETIRTFVTAAGIQFQLPDGSAANVLRVSAPDGEVYEQRGGDEKFVTLTTELKDGTDLGDGLYQWELVSTLRDARSRAATRDTERSGERGPSSASFVSASGTFRISGGMFVTPRTEQAGRLVSPDATGAAPNDQIITDDLIAQQGACFGTGCADGEDFTASRFLLKGMNNRIRFDDTSDPGYAANDWQLTLNESTAGGAGKVSIDDLTAGTTPFTIMAGAPSNTIFVDALGRLGLGTSTPFFNLHLAAANSPTMRLQQTGTLDFDPQTWDVGGNETSFFVRDVTGGSRLPFRVRPGAPTNSIVVAPGGNVGIGLFDPQENLHLFAAEDANTFLMVENAEPAPAAAAVLRAKSNGSMINFQAHSTARTISRFGQVLGGWTELLSVTGNGLALGTFNSAPLILGTGSVSRLHITSAGNIGIGTSTPSHPLQMASGAHVTAGGVWTNASSRALKEDIRALSPADAMEALSSLQPVTFRYSAEKDETYVGFIAEDVPELVATGDRRSLSSMDVVAVLTKVVQEQQQTIEKLEKRLAELEAER